MMVGNPNWWSMHHQPSLIPPQYVFPPSSIPFNSLTENPDQSCSQLLFTGLPGEEEKNGFSHFQAKKLENWDVQILNSASRVPFLDVMKQQVYHQRGNLYDHSYEEFQASWSHVSSAGSCFTSLNRNNNDNNNILDFTYNKSDHRKSLLQDQISQCNSTATASVCKKARVQPPSSQAPLRVRKEKLGDRITTLHQLVSPFGKTDTASVLLEAIGYIRFLQGQIEALSSPYLDNASKNTRNQQFLLNDNNNGLKRKGAPNQDGEEKAKDLKSRGLCLVPVSCTHHVASQIGTDYCPPTLARGF